MSVAASKFTGSGMTSDRTRARMIDALRSKGVKIERVLNVMAEVPRHVFVEEALQERAYETDKALPIGHGQTISTPEIVAIMTSLLCEGALGIPAKVLEIGTGCGYQAALLCELASRVVSVERLADTVNYEHVASAAKAIAASGHIGLVESFAWRLAEACFEEPRVLRARVRVEKPQALAPDAAAAGVEITAVRG